MACDAVAEVVQVTTRNTYLKLDATLVANPPAHAELRLFHVASQPPCDGCPGDIGFIVAATHEDKVVEIVVERADLKHLRLKWRTITELPNLGAEV